MSITMYQQSAYELPLPDNSVDLIITNPPHWQVEGSYYGGDQTEQLSHGIATDRVAYFDSLKKATKEMIRVLSDKGNLIIAVGQGEYPRYNTIEYEHVLFCTQELNLHLTSEINWDISPNIFSHENLHHEHKIFRHYTKRPDYVRNSFEITNLNPASWKIAFTENNPELLKIGGVGHGFPVELASRFIRCFSETSSVIFDPFAGTGTVNIAASLHGRNSVYLDYSKEQYALAKRRFELFNFPPALEG